MSLRPIKSVSNPYTSKYGRRRVYIHYEDGTKKVHQYAKWLMMLKEDRELDPDLETVDHIDGDFTNDNIDNLQIIPRSQHSSLDALRVKDIEANCILCGKSCIKRYRFIKHNNIDNGKSGPFCSKVCTGLHTHLVDKHPEISGWTELSESLREVFKNKDN